MGDFLTYIILFLIWLISTLVVRAIFRTKTHLPPSPFRLPVLGHLHLLAPIPHQALHKLSTRLGPLIHIYLGSVPCLVASSPEMAKEFLKTKESFFSDRPKISAVDYLTYGSQDFSFAPYGPYWKFMKKVIMSELLGGRTLDLLQPVRRDEISRLMSCFSEIAKDSRSVDVGSELIGMANNVISRMLMSERCSEGKEKASEIKNLVKDIAELTGKFNLSDYVWFCKNLDLQGFKMRLKVVRDRFDTMMERIIDEHEAARKEKKMSGESDDDVKDLLDILLDIAQDNNMEMKLSKENIKAFILDIFAAGTDTSAITTEWALSELINHPKIMSEAVRELDSVIGKSRIIQESDIPYLPYLQSIVKETLRLHPTGPLIVRESSSDCTIGDYNIPAKTRLFVNVWALGRDPSHWEDPLEFKPERFNSRQGQMDVRGQNYHLLPFGSGRRGCPGTTLALQVVHVSLGAMLQCFEWKVEENDGKVDMDEGVGLTLPRAHPLVCKPVLRFDSLPSL